MSSTAEAPSVSGDELPAGDAAVLAVEYRLQLGERLERRVGSDTVVAGDDLRHLGPAEPGRDLRGKPSVQGRGGRTLMTHQRDPVLVLSRNAVFLRHLLGRLPHGFAGGGLGDGG
jgi:hypothetical protein